MFSVAYKDQNTGQYKTLEPGSYLTPKEASDFPRYTIDQSIFNYLENLEDGADPRLAIIMWDENAEFVHEFSVYDSNKGEFIPLVSYKGPAPPKGSGEHKYSFFLYIIPDFSSLISDDHVPSNSRRRLSLNEFVEKNNMFLVPWTRNNDIFFFSSSDKPGKQRRGTMSFYDKILTRLERQTKKKKTRNIVSNKGINQYY